MDKELRSYNKYIDDKICEIIKQLKKGDKENNTQIRAKLQALTQYHNQTIRNFQHERFIHLIVTFFFAGLLILSTALLVYIASSQVISNQTTLTNLSICITLILLVTEIFYIKHYFILENYTQSLYKYSKKMFEIEQDNLTY